MKPPLFTDENSGARTRAYLVEYNWRMDHE